MRIRLIKPLFVLLALALAAGGACSEKSEVGSGVEVEGDGSGSGAFRDSTTTAAPTTAPVQTTSPTTAAPTTTKATAPPTTQQQVALTITIVNRSQYDPSVGAVRAGQIVEWVNNDDRPRRVVAPGAFASPAIAPGGRWQWKANVVGEHNYQDPDVPFGVGKLSVQ